MFAMVLETGCAAMLCAGVMMGWVVWAAETTATVCIGPLWMAVVVKSLRTGPLVGVGGVENLTVMAFVTTLAATRACVVAITLLVRCLRLAVANTD